MNAYSLQELQADLSLSNLSDDPDTNLELAANIGKLLLERNEQLQCSLHEYMEKVEVQEQELWNLTRQTKALHEVNDSRIKIYEQLEVNIEELERANHQLLLQNLNEKELVKDLKESIKSLESKCAELNEHIAFLNRELEKHKATVVEEEHVSVEVQIITEQEVVIQEQEPTCNKNELKAHIAELTEQLDACHVKLSKDEVKIKFLEEQLNTLVLRNNDLEDQLLQDESEPCENDIHREEVSLFDEIEEDDSFFEELGCYPQAESSPKPKAALLRDLIEKYEAVLELHKNKGSDDDDKSVDSGMKSVSPTFSSSNRSGLSSPSDSYLGSSKSLNNDLIDLSKRTNSSDSNVKSRSGLTSPTSDFVSNSTSFADKTTQTEPDYIYEVDDVKVEIYKNGNKLRTKLCNKHKCKRLFREFLATLEECSADEDNIAGDKIRTALHPPSNPTGRVSPPPQCNLASKQNAINLNSPPTQNIQPNSAEKIANNLKQSGPVLIPYVRELIVDEYSNKKKSTKKKRTHCNNHDTPILVGYSNTAKTVEIPIDFHFEQLKRYRKSPAFKNLSMLKKMETSYSALLKKTESKKAEFSNAVHYRK